MGFLEKLVLAIHSDIALSKSEVELDRGSLLAVFQL